MKKVNDLDITSEEKASLEGEAVKNGIDESVTPGFILLRDFMIIGLKKMLIRIMEYGHNLMETNITNLE